MIDSKLRAEFEVQRAHGGCRVGFEAADAMRRAKAILYLESRGDIVLWMEDDDLDWEKEFDVEYAGPRPEYVMCLAIVRLTWPGETSDDYRLRDGRPKGEWLASVGGVGVNSLRDPYLRAEFGSLAVEAMATIREEWQQEADELSRRATYAGVES